MTTPTQRSQRQLRPFFIIFCDSTDSGPLTPRSLCLFSLRTALEDGRLGRRLTANRRHVELSSGHRWNHPPLQQPVPPPVPADQVEVSSKPVTNGGGAGGRSNLRCKFT